MNIVNTAILDPAVGWFILWLDTARIIRFGRLKPPARPIIAIILIALMALTTGGTAYGAFLLNASTSSLGTIFGSGPAVDESDGRYNILILGADAGEGRDVDEDVGLEVEDQRHQRFGDVAAAELAEMPALVRLVAEGVWLLGHTERAAWQKAAILSLSLTPGPRSTPEEVSTR